MTTKRMASIKAAALLLTLSAILHGQDGQQSAQPQQPQQPQVRVAPTSDLFTEELRAARQLHGEWDGLDDQTRGRPPRGGAWRSPGLPRTSRPD